MISFPRFDVERYSIIVTRHAMVRAFERCVDAELVLRIVKHGSIERFGKHGIRFIRNGKRTLICVGEIHGEAIKILTVEEG